MTQINGAVIFSTPLGKTPSLVVRNFMDFVRSHAQSIVVEHLAKISG